MAEIKKMTELEYHPISIHFPLLDEKELKEMSDDIKGSGLQNPIVLYEGKILDGRNRYLACKMAGVSPRFENYNGNDPLGFVFSLNILRRNLDTTQRGALATKFVSMRSGERTDITENQPRLTRAEVDNINKPISIQEAADLAGVSRSTVVRAKKIFKNDPKKFDDLVTGKLTIGEAYREIKRKEGKSENKQASQKQIVAGDGSIIVIDKGRAKAFEHANRAIEELKQIPRSEAARREAYITVKNFITVNINNKPKL